MNPTRILFLKNVARTSVLGKLRMRKRYQDSSSPGGGARASYRTILPQISAWWSLSWAKLQTPVVTEICQPLDPAWQIHFIDWSKGLETVVSVLFSNTRTRALTVQWMRNFQYCTKRSWVQYWKFWVIALCGIVNQLINFSVNGFCKNYASAFHGKLSLKAYSFLGLYSIEIKPDGGYLVITVFRLYHVISFIQWETEEIFRWIIISNISFCCTDIPVFKICKLAKWWPHKLNRILIKYDGKRYPNQFVWEMLDSLP